MFNSSLVLPDYRPAMASLALEFVHAANARNMSAALNKLLKRISEQRLKVRETRRQWQYLPMRRVQPPLPQNPVPQDVDELYEQTIAEYVSAEQQISKLRSQSRDIARQTEARSREDGTGRPALIRRVADAADLMFVDVLVLLRDMRWDVMAARADAEPRSKGAIITNAAELRRSFEGPTTA